MNIFSNVLFILPLDYMFIAKKGQQKDSDSITLGEWQQTKLNHNKNNYTTNRVGLSARIQLLKVQSNQITQREPKIDNKS